MKNICNDLRQEYETLDALVANLTEEEWQQLTPFYNWTIYDEICHISYFDGTALFATKDRKAFQEHASVLMREMAANDSLPAIVNDQIGIMIGQELLQKWRREREELLDRLGAMGPKDRLPWYGPDMSALSFATARLMETWAHGQDVYDTLKIRRQNTDSIKHIAHLGVTTFGWSFVNRKLLVPEAAIRIELISPSGELWAWGPEEADESVKGSAEDFCLMVTQRRHVADTALEYTGDAVKQWLSIAQCFAGPPADGPASGVRFVEV